MYQANSANPGYGLTVRKLFSPRLVIWLIALVTALYIISLALGE